MTSIDPRTIAHYNSNAAAYTKKVSHIFLEDEMEYFLNKLSIKSIILDLGCGSGKDLRLFRQYGFMGVGVDASESLAKIAMENSHCPIIIADMDNIPLPSESVDGVWAISSIIHAPRDRFPAILNEIYRVLLPGGYFTSSMSLGSGEDRDETTGRLFTRVSVGEWHSLLENAGFVIQDKLPQISEVQNHTNLKWLSTCVKKPR